jgi:hypothetical protein
MARSRSIDSDCPAEDRQGSGATMNIRNWTGRLMPVHHDGLLRWLARLVANRWVSLALVAAVVIVDFTIPWQGMRSVPRAMVWIVVVLIVATVVARYWSQRAKTPAASAAVSILAGAAWGISAHFLRDVATAPMPLWWPVTKAAAEVPHWWYGLALLVIIAIPPARFRMGVAEEQPAGHAATPDIDTGTSTRLSRENYPKEPDREVTPCAYL